jgi:hypothetical protein
LNLKIKLPTVLLLALVGDTKMMKEIAMSKIDNPELGCEFFEECLVRIGKIAIAAGLPSEYFFDVDAMRKILFELTEHAGDNAFEVGYDAGFDDGYAEGYSDKENEVVN